MNTVVKLNNTLGYLTAMSFDKPELRNDLAEPMNILSEAISEIEELESQLKKREFPKKDFDKRIESYNELTIKSAKPSYHFANGAEWMFNFLTSETK